MAVKAKGPQFIRFMKPIIEVLLDSGGSATSSEVAEKVIERMNIPDEEQSVILKSGQSRVYNQVHWARMYLVNGGILDSSKRGVWTLTALGNKTHPETFDALKFFKTVHKQYVSKKEAEAEASQDDAVGEEPISEVTGDYRPNLLGIIRSLPPAGFERLCQRLLREHGFEQVNVTGKSGDGGIDGVGILQVNKFVSFTVLFQCKRYEGSVTPSQVRDFRARWRGVPTRGSSLPQESSRVKQEKRLGVTGRNRSNWSTATHSLSCSNHSN